MAADGLTKALGPTRFSKFLELLGLSKDSPDEKETEASPGA